MLIFLDKFNLLYNGKHQTSLVSTINLVSIFRIEQEPIKLRDEHKLVAEESNNYQKIHKINPTLIEAKRFKILKGDWPNHKIIGYINSGQMKYCPETKSFNVWPVSDPNNIDERRVKN